MGSAGYRPKERPNNNNNSSLSQLGITYTLLDEETQKIYNSIPKDQYLCPLRGEIPLLANIHTDNGCIEFKCKKDGELLYSIPQYFKKLSECNFTYYNIRCCECNKIQKNYIKNSEIFQFCYICQRDYCNDCVRAHPKHPKSHLKKCIPTNAKTSRCLEHFEEGNYTSFCPNCYKHVCNEMSSKIHRDHNIIFHFKIQPKKQIIIEKNKLLLNIIRFNELILQTYEQFPDNYFHSQNLANLAESIIVENSRNSKQLESALKCLEQKIKYRETAIEKFNRKFKMSLNGNEESLSLKNIGLNDEDFKLITDINFQKLKELDISNNKIRNVDSLRNIDTSNLEYLNMSHNIIETIEVLESLNLTHLIELGLQNNNIKNVSSLLKLDAPKLELLRIEGNKEMDQSLNDFKNLMKKYTKKIIYSIQTFSDFNKKYESNISKESEIIDLSNKQAGNNIIKDLYLLSSNYDHTKKLSLANNKIDDISILSRISFKKLVTLDLSMNHIKNIDTLNKMECKNLNCLYLNDNRISYITIFKTLKLRLNKLSIVSLKENNIVSQNQEVQNTIKELQNSNITIDIV